MYRLLMNSLTPAEREAMGVAAVASLGDITSKKPEATEPVTLMTGEKYFRPLSFRLDTNDLRLVYREAYPSGIIKQTLENFLKSFSQEFPSTSKEQPDLDRETDSTAPSHAMLEISRTHSAGVTLFDCQQIEHHPMVIRLHQAKDINKQEPSANVFRMSGNKLLSVMMSEHQYTRLIRCDRSLTPCTISQLGWMRYNLDENPHLKQGMTNPEMKNATHAITAAETSTLKELIASLEAGITRKDDRDQAIQIIKEALSNIPSTTKALHEFAGMLQEKAYNVAEKRHNRTISHEIDSLSTGMQKKLKHMGHGGSEAALIMTTYRARIP